MNQATKTKEKVICRGCGSSYTLEELKKKNCLDVVTKDSKGYELPRPKLRACCPNCTAMWEYNLTKQAGEVIQGKLSRI